MVEHLTLDNFEEQVVNSKEPVVIDFYADWCGPCKMMAPVFESLSKEYEGKMKFLKLDTQTEQGLAVKFGVQGIPTLVFVKNGEEVDRVVGMVPEDSLKSKIDSIIE